MTHLKGTSTPWLEPSTLVMVEMETGMVVTEVAARLTSIILTPMQCVLKTGDLKLLKDINLID